MDEHQNGNERLDRYVAHINDSEVPEIRATVLAWKGEQFLGVHEAMPDNRFSPFLTFFGLNLTQQKDLHARAIGTFLGEIDADAYAYIDEAWSTIRKKDKLNDGPSPANSSDRKEVVILHYEHKSGPQVGRCYPLVRSQGIIRLSEPDQTLTSVGEGRYTRLFDKYTT